MDFLNLFIAEAEKEIKGLAGRLGNPNFADKEPPEVVAECQANLDEKQAQADLARKRLVDLSCSHFRMLLISLLFNNLCQHWL